MYDLVIKDGNIVDGSGTSIYQADIGIKDDRISTIGKIAKDEARFCINARGLIVSPGFIDSHSHSDIDVINVPFAPNKIRQGVTTEVAGLCGYSLFPIVKENIGNFQVMLRSFNKSFDLDWLSASEYFHKVEKIGIGFNYVPFVGHGILRANAVGFANRKATKEELENMKILLDECMKQGVKGLSTGLQYAPGCFSDTDELIELCKVVARYGGIYSSHLRNQGERLLESVKEAIEIGKRTGVSVVISHLKASQKKNWGKMPEALALIEAGRSQGVNVICDFYPYTYANSTLILELPFWLNDGGVENLIERITHKDVRTKVRNEMEAAGDVNWDKVIVSEVKTLKNKYLEGMSIGNIANDQKKSPYDIVFDLLIEERGAVQVVSGIMCKADVEAVALYKHSTLGSDAYAISDDFVNFKGHPRNFGTFPKFIKEYVREKELLTLPEAIRKMTHATAQFYGIENRGLIREGNYADITIFDKDLIGDRATYEMPREMPDGIKYVLVNGRIQVVDNEPLRIPSGKVLV